MVEFEEPIGDHGRDDDMEALERLLRPGVPTMSGGTGGISPTPL